MRGAVPLGRWAGVPVGMHWSVLVIAGLLTQIVAQVVLPRTAPGNPDAVYWVAGAVVAVVFMASLLAHELAHAMVAVHYGIRVERVTLWLLGGVTEFSSEAQAPKADLLIAAAGPLASMLCGALFVGVAAGGAALHAPTIVLASAAWLGITNLILAVFNLLPGAPLDGGRVLRAVLWRRSGNRTRAAITATRVGGALGGGLFGLGVIQAFSGSLLDGLWLGLLGWFLVEMASAERRQVGLRDRLHGIAVGDVMSVVPVTAPGWWTVETFLDRIGRHEHHRVYPVLDFTGRPCGLVSLAALTVLKPDTRMASRVSDVARRLEKVPTTTPDRPLVELLATIRLDPSRDLVLVLEDGWLRGVISQADITRAIHLAELGHKPARPGSRSPLEGQDFSGDHAPWP